MMNDVIKLQPQSCRTQAGRRSDVRPIAKLNFATPLLISGMVYCIRLCLLVVIRCPVAAAVTEFEIPRADFPDRAAAYQTTRQNRQSH